MWFAAAFGVMLLLQATLACQPPDCNRQDCGTCGNACCTLKFIVYGSSSEELFSLLSRSLTGGGADGRYRLIGAQNLAPFNVSADFIIQAQHQTLVHHYNDTLNFAFYTDPANAAVEIYAFSISDIATAFCDEGQNYKNIVGFIKGLDLGTYAQVSIAGCPPAPDAPETPQTGPRRPSAPRHQGAMGSKTPLSFGGRFGGSNGRMTWPRDHGARSVDAHYQRQPRDDSVH